MILRQVLCCLSHLPSLWFILVFYFSFGNAGNPDQRLTRGKQVPHARTARTDQLSYLPIPTFNLLQQNGGLALSHQISGFMVSRKSASVGSNQQGVVWC